MTDLDAIIDRMSEAERDALLMFRLRQLLWAANQDEIFLINGMMKKGLVGKVVVNGENAMDIMPLGQAVRARIIERKDHEQ